MMAELIRHSDAPERIELVDPDLRKSHRPNERVVRDDAPAAQQLQVARPSTKVASLWEGDGDLGGDEEHLEIGADDEALLGGMLGF